MKILIIKLSALGDIVHAIPALNALHEKHPEAKIDWLCYKSFAPILRSQSKLNQIIEVPDRKLTSLYSLAKDLCHENYDLVIDMQGLIKTAALARLISQNTRGFKEPREQLASIFYKEKIDAGNTMNNDMHIVERNLTLACHPEEHQRRQDPPGTNETLTPKGLRMTQPFVPLQQEAKLENKVCLIPSSTWSSKLWAPKRWAALIDQIKDKDPKTQIYLLGTLKDLMVIEKIICLSKAPLHIVVNKELIELPGFFSEMKLVIGVDTGPLHIAAAALYGSEAQVIGLYGPSSGARTGPYGFKAISVDEISDYVARNKRDNDDSMSLIEVSTVIASIA